ncbi:hypothetical protein J6590_005088 [Homalodisca vitripennis]|nr:hypothetical protein J6590_005088 [Homalodisca vitripennis]
MTELGTNGVVVEQIIEIYLIRRLQMRSSVSVILSSPTPDTNMSHPDYDQNAHDHATLLVLVKQIGK